MKIRSIKLLLIIRTGLQYQASSHIMSNDCVHIMYNFVIFKTVSKLYKISTSLNVSFTIWNFYKYERYLWLIFQIIDEDVFEPWMLSPMDIRHRWPLPASPLYRSTPDRGELTNLCVPGTWLACTQRPCLWSFSAFLWGYWVPQWCFNRKILSLSPLPAFYTWDKLIKQVHTGDSTQGVRMVRTLCQLVPQYIFYTLSCLCRSDSRTQA